MLIHAADSLMLAGINVCIFLDKTMLSGINIVVRSGLINFLGTHELGLRVFISAI